MDWRRERPMAGSWPAPRCSDHSGSKAWRMPISEMYTLTNTAEPTDSAASAAGE
ncbi:hypothetical protein D3C71_2003640 [compost metagenome]